METSTQTPEKSYRIFISYSHEDKEIAEILADVIEENGLTLLWDQSLQFGIGFPDQIKSFIAHSHVFIPLITEMSSTRGWVHQEIGYAQALRIPMLPICIGKVPGEMLAALHGVILDPKTDKETIKQRLQSALKSHVLERLTGTGGGYHQPLFESASFPEDRAQMMADYASQVFRLFKPGLLRQIGGLSSMHIPSKDINAPVWDERYGGVDRRGFHRKWQRNERLALEKHALGAGYRLIVDPWIKFRDYGPKARIARLQSLLDFLESSDKAPVAEIAFKESDSVKKTEENNTKNKSRFPTIGHSLTCIGDWFLAESIAGRVGLGYLQTLFTRHPAYIQSRIESFDSEFARLLQMQGWSPESSRDHAIEELATLIMRLKSELAES